MKITMVELIEKQIKIDKITYWHEDEIQLLQNDIKELEIKIKEKRNEIDILNQIAQEILRDYGVKCTNCKGYGKTVDAVAYDVSSTATNLNYELECKVCKGTGYITLYRGDNKK